MYLRTLLNSTLRTFSLAGRRVLNYINITSLNIHTFFSGYLNVLLLIFIQGCMMIDILNSLVLNTLGPACMHHLSKQKINSKTCYF